MPSLSPAISSSGPPPSSTEAELPAATSAAASASVAPTTIATKPLAYAQAGPSSTATAAPIASLPLLLQISFIDLLEVDSRPAFVVSLASLAPVVVYCNPALTDSPTLRDIISAPRASHAAIWDGIVTIAPGDSPAGSKAPPRPLPTIVHLGRSWTRTVLGGCQYAVISANQPATTEPAPAALSTAGAAGAAGTAGTEEALVSSLPEGRQVRSTTPVAPAAVLKSDDDAHLSIPARSTPTTKPIATRTKRPLPPQLLQQPPAPPTPPTSAVFSPPEDGSNQDWEASSAITQLSVDRTASFGSGVGLAAVGSSSNDNDDSTDAGTAGASGTSSAEYLHQIESITDFMPVGMSVFDAAGNVCFANNAWYHIMGCAPAAAAAPGNIIMKRSRFLSYIEDEDLEIVQHFFAQAASMSNKTFGFRVKKHEQQEGAETLAAAAITSTSTTPTSTIPAIVAHSPPSTPGGSPRNGPDSTSTPRRAASLLSASSSKTATPKRTPTLTASTTDERGPPVRRNSLALALKQEKLPRGSHVLATAHSETDAQGRLVRILVCLRDITEHQHIAEVADRHAQQANNLRRMAEFATVGMYDLDIDGRLRGANRVFYEMCGLEKGAAEDGEIIQPWLKCVAPEDQQLIRTCLDRLVSAVGHSSGLGGDQLEPGSSAQTDGQTGVQTSAQIDTDTEMDHQTVEVRFKTPWTADDGAGGRIVAPRWVEASFLPVKDSDGNVQSVTGCLSDISLRRWQLERERQVKEEAIESKRQQENFVDITSHEIRNPLTVIMHCGDAVLECLTKLRDDIRASSSASANDQALAMLEDAIDYAEIIVGSALHQKAIVDDILTMSKLDSDLLAVTPVTVDPIEIVRSTLKMFEVQARQQNIQLRMAVDSSYYKELPASSLFTTTNTSTSMPTPTHFLVLDPSRVKQILINLLTNALKFTQAVDVREVTTTISVSRTRPTNAMCAVSFVPPPTDNKLAHAYSHSGGGAGVGTAVLSKPTSLFASSPSSPSSTVAFRPPMSESVFLIFEVKDTGEGLTKEGMDSLFQKFVQAGSNTHVKHGGSGLGLFISKRLAEIQNGAIGVASAPGVGSSFVFYIEAYIPPPNAVPEVLSPGEAAKIALATGLGSVTGGLAAPTPTSGSSIKRKDDSITSLSPEMWPITSKPDRDQQTDNNPTRSSSNSSYNNNGPQVAASPITVHGTAASGSQTTAAKATNVTQTTGGAGGQLASISAAPPEIQGVLLVEDNIVNRKVTRRYFEKSGFHVQVAANGLEAMDIIQASNRCVPGSYPISVVLMDMEMPVQDGLTCTRHIRALEAAGAFAGGRIPVLMITGNARPEQIADARAVGCDDVVVKPFQMHLLFEHIKLVMQTLWEEDVRALGSGVVDGQEGSDSNGDGSKENKAAVRSGTTPLDQVVVLQSQNGGRP